MLHTTEIHTSSGDTLFIQGAPGVLTTIAVLGPRGGVKASVDLNAAKRQQLIQVLLEHEQDAAMPDLPQTAVDAAAAALAAEDARNWGYDHGFEVGDKETLAMARAALEAAAPHLAAAERERIAAVIEPEADHGRQ